jgi:hypothetical protein
LKFIVTMPKVKDNDLILAIRMCELCRPPTAWNRSLWSVSTQTILREVLEASQFRRDGMLSDASVADLQSTAAIVVGTDPGAGDADRRRFLEPFLRRHTIITPGSLAAANIESAVDDWDANYYLGGRQLRIKELRRSWSSVPVAWLVTCSIGAKPHKSSPIKRTSVLKGCQSQRLANCPRSANAGVSTSSEISGCPSSKSGTAQQQDSSQGWMNGPSVQVDAKTAFPT